MKQLIAILKTKDLYLGLFRYMLGVAMIPFGLTKIMRTQFIVYPLSTWQLPLESLTGINLAWAFLGHSPWFEMLLGFLELMPAMLLLFRRTTLLGAILMLPMTLNVLLINYAFQLWSGTKNTAIVLFALNCLVLVLEPKNVKAICRAIVSWGLRIRFTTIELAANIILILVVGYYALTPLLDYKKQTNDLTGDWYNQRPIEWVLRSEHRNGGTAAHRDMRCYFLPMGNYEEISNAHASVPPDKYIINPQTRSLTFRYEKQGHEVRCKYYLMADTGLQLETIVDSNKQTKLTQVFAKHIIYAGINP